MFYIKCMHVELDQVYFVPLICLLISVFDCVCRINA